MSERIKRRIKREATKAKTDLGQALRHARQGQFKAAGREVGEAAGRAKMALFGNREGTKIRGAVPVSGTTIGSDGKKKAPGGQRVVVRGSPVQKKVRDRRAAARKAALTRKAKGGR